MTQYHSTIVGNSHWTTVFCKRKPHYHSTREGNYHSTKVLCSDNAIISLLWYVI